MQAADHQPDGSRRLDELKPQHAGLKVHVVMTSGGNPPSVTKPQRCGLVTDTVEHDHADLT